jgi:hypothetical protein
MRFESGFVSAGQRAEHVESRLIGELLMHSHTYITALDGDGMDRTKV